MPTWIPSSRSTWTKRTPPDVRWYSVSSYMITPDRCLPSPSVVYSSSRKRRRFSGVFSTPTVDSRFPTVAWLSSVARMPQPRRAISFAVTFISARNMFSRSKALVMEMEAVRKRCDNDAAW